MSEIEQLNQELIFRTSKLAEEIDEVKQDLEETNKAIRLLMLLLSEDSLASPEDLPLD